MVEISECLRVRGLLFWFVVFGWQGSRAVVSGALPISTESLSTGGSFGLTGSVLKIPGLTPP